MARPNKKQILVLEDEQIIAHRNELRVHDDSDEPEIEFRAQLIFRDKAGRFWEGNQCFWLKVHLVLAPERGKEGV